MNFYSKINLDHPLISAHKINEISKKVFKNETSIYSGWSNKDSQQRRDKRIVMQILGCTSGFERVGRQSQLFPM